jgi:hypothetical protein
VEKTVHYIKGLSPDKSLRSRQIQSAHQRSGTSGATIEITGKVEGALDLVRENKFAGRMDYVVIADRINKIARREKEACYFAFPFRVEHPVVRYDAGWGVVRLIVTTCRSLS